MKNSFSFSSKAFLMAGKIFTPKNLEQNWRKMCSCVLRLFINLIFALRHFEFSLFARIFRVFLTEAEKRKDYFCLFLLLLEILEHVFGKFWGLLNKFYRECYAVKFVRISSKLFFLFLTGKTFLDVWFSLTFWNH